MKPLFYSDYLEGAHPYLLQVIQEANLEQNPGYGEDDYCKEAARRIKEAFCVPDADVHFLEGGTQTNATVISSVLKPYQGVLCPDTAHIAVHETGAIEHIGHKTLTLKNTDGKISAAQILDAVVGHYSDANHEHVVQPGMVYISFPTELGTIYSKKELIEISAACKECKIPLFIDGARLGYGLMCNQCDIEPEDLGKIADIFYVGGTKQGALFGEALVICNDAYKKDFRYNIKQNGGMMAKGWLLGLQFAALFTDNLYFSLSEHALAQAAKIREAIKEKGLELFGSSPTNQVFVVLSLEQQERLAQFVGYEYWQKTDETHGAVRLCTSWATTDEAVEILNNAIKSL
ncbi:MAG: low specificity L-threonine aldolase [Bacteroidales bacterium]|nr:low specificity L-threonine aldolase [Bacteroidales bacterium]